MTDLMSPPMPEPVLAAVPREGVPRSAKQKKVQRRFRLVLAGAVCGPIALLIALASGGGSRTSVSVELRYRGIAQIAAEDYLAGRSLSLPADSNITADLGRPLLDSANGSTRGVPLQVDAIAWTAGESRTAQGVRYEVHHFDVRSGSALFAVAVTIAERSGGPVLAALPSLAPIVGGAAGGDGIAYGGQSSLVNLSSGAQAQIATWFKAYAGDDRVALLAATGDTRSVVYQGLGGFEIVGTPIVIHAYNAGGSTVIVRTRATLRSTGDDSLVFNVDEDLLLADLGEALPHVVAWGAAGEGPTLKPYLNALGAASNDAIRQAANSTTTVPAFTASTTTSSTSVVSNSVSTTSTSLRAGK